MALGFFSFMIFTGALSREELLAAWDLITWKRKELKAAWTGDGAYPFLGWGREILAGDFSDLWL
jgi:hypothetical protein